MSFVMFSYCIISLKAFGDFTIALSVLNRIHSSSDVPPLVIIAGEHLRPLAKALDAEHKVFFIGDKRWCDVPAAFNVGKLGKWAALRSLFELRTCIKSLSCDRILVFDKIGLRESFISAGLPRMAISTDKNNIYAAYAELFSSLGYKIEAVTKYKSYSKPLHAVLVPGSRIARKKIPRHVSAAINKLLDERGIRLKAIRLDGEDVDLPNNLDTQTLPRNFSDLCSALRDSDLIISADSLSAHLGEHFGIPSFIFTPSPNTYWLPSVAFRDSAWALFNELHVFGAWLDKQPHIAA